MKSKFYTILLVTALLISVQSVEAQSHTDSLTQKELYSTIAHLDSIVFNAYNTQTMKVFKPMFTQDLEWYQDNGGLVPYDTVFKNFAQHFSRENKLNRQLVKGTLKVYPIKDYGAIEIGQHEFRHIENGKEEVGTFEFLMIWRKTNTNWQIARVVSYGHKM